MKTWRGERLRYGRRQRVRPEPPPLSGGSHVLPGGEAGDSTVVAVSLGHLGVRTDWSLLRSICERLPGLTLLLVGGYYDDQAAGDPAYAWCRACPQIVWFGRLDDEAAARVILLADVGIVPFKVGPYNDAGLPYRIIKYARLGRRTVSPELAGVKTWDPAVTTVPDYEAFAAELLKQAGTRLHPDTELREWALAQTAEAMNAPLWDRLGALGVALTRSETSRARRGH